MSSRIAQELELLRQFYPQMEYREEGHWVLLPRYSVPERGGWNFAEVDTAFQMPPGLPGQAPYGFYVRPVIALRSGHALQNAAPATEQVAWPGPWLKFSWSPANWQPAAEVRDGSNMLQFALSFSDRFGEGA